MYLTFTGRSLDLTSGTNNWTISGTAGVSRVGTAKNDIFYISTSEKVSGLGGDDIYQLWGAGADISERAGDGNDTVYVNYWGGITLAANIENVVLSSAGATWATGNASDNLIIAGSAGAKLNGAKGDDVLVGGSGADIFTVDKGNGNDVVVNFKPGWDVIDLTTYGYKSFAQLKAAGTQSGKDAVFKLAGGETLTLRDTDLSSLGAADFKLPLNPLSSSAGDLSLKAGQALNYNGWVVLTNAWGSSNLKEGVDYKLNTVFNPKSPTTGTAFEWSYPLSNSSAAKILAYPEVIFGHSPLDVAPSNPNDKAAVFPVKVADMMSLKANYDVSFSGNLAQFNVSYDIWLSKDPKAIGKNHVSNEIMIWVHKGGFEAFGKVVGTYQWGNATANIYHDGTYTALVFDRDIPKGNLDVAAIIQKLVSLNIVSKDEYIRSLEFGSEVNGGQGQLVINNLDLSVQTRNADGSSTTKAVTGAGTTVTTTATAAPSKATLLTQDSFKAVVSEATAESVDARGHKIGTHTSTVEANGSVSVKDYNLAGSLTGSKMIVNLGTSVQTQRYDASGKFAGAEQRDFAKDGVVSVSQFNENWKVVGSTLTKGIGNGRIEVQKYDANYKLISADQSYTEANGAKTTLHYNSAWGFNGATTVYEKGAGKTTYMYDAKWALTGREETSFSAKAGSEISKTSYYNAGGKLTGVDQVQYYSDHTTYTKYDAKNVLTGGHSVYMLQDGSEKTTMFDANMRDVKQSLVGTSLVNIMEAGSLSTDFHGGAGSDVMKGGSGLDRFFFDHDIRKEDVDSISNFTAKQDKIVLDHKIFTSLVPGDTLDPAMLTAGRVAKDANDHVLFDTTSGGLYYDADGKGGADAVLLAHVDVSSMLSGSNFIVI